MKRTILIPTDFSIESLSILKPILNECPQDVKLDIILLQGVSLDNSITDLLFFSKLKVIDEHSGESFDDACKVLMNKYTNVLNSVRKDIFTGVTQAAFNNYLEANKVDEIIVPDKPVLEKNKKCFDLKPFIDKSNVNVAEMKVSVKYELPEKGLLAEIFYNGTTTTVKINS
jgi:hypothetical protein